MTEQHYKNNEARLISILEENYVGVLGTSVDNYVTTRTMYYLNIGFEIFVLTNRTYFKNEQINKNNIVSYTINNISIDGKIYEQEKDEQHELLYDNLLKTNYLRFSQGDDLILYRIEPDIIKIWGKPVGKPKRMFLYPKLRIISETTLER